MSFQLVQKSVTLNDLERRNGRYFSLFSEVGSFGANYRKVVKDNRYLRQKSNTKNLVLAICDFLATFVEIKKNKSIKESHPVTSDDLINTAR